MKSKSRNKARKKRKAVKSKTTGCISVRGAREHNLKGVNVDIPRDRLVVITGLSGSGKSSLAFDTIYAEGQRRFVESMSAYARQFLEQIQKPDVESIEGLTPTVAIEQRTGRATPRSIVATTTEIYDYLRLFYARAGTPYCHICGREITAQPPEVIVDKILRFPENSRIHIYGPVIRDRKGEHRDVIDFLKREGFVRLRIDGEVIDARKVKSLKKTFKHTVEAVIDRMLLRRGVRSRLNDAVEMALKLGDGLVTVRIEPPDDKKFLEETYSEKFACPVHGPVLEELSPHVFSFNNPAGACPTCSGLGKILEPDPDLVVRDPSLSLLDGAINAWKRCGSGLGHFYRRSVMFLAEMFDAHTNTPWKDLPRSVRRMMMYGTRESDERKLGIRYEGIVPHLARRFRETDSERLKSRIHEYFNDRVCPACGGKRLRPEILAVRIGGGNIMDLTAMSVTEGLEFLRGLSFDAEKTIVAAPVLKAVTERLGFLNNVGLGYLTLDRATNTLSGGEAQRIRLATQVGSRMVGVTYVLDEPTIGLHPRDTHRLLKTLLELRDVGNTVIVVEHDRDIIRSADWLVDLGPRAGEHGGEIVAKGPPGKIISGSDTLTGKYLSGEMKISAPSSRRKVNLRKAIVVKGAAENNLKKINVAFPLGVFTCVTGVSGSGKSSLAADCLYKGLARKLGGKRIRPGKHRNITGVGLVDKVIQIDQSPIGRTPRSNPATYTNVFGEIRKVFAMTPEAKVRGYNAGRFSFNVKGGRCEACRGQGVKTIEMHFLPDVHVTCEVCKGLRYNRETLQIKYRGMTIADVLGMSVEKASRFFRAHPKIAPILDTLFAVGLGYIRLGQPSTTLSGGEAQRIKLASELGKKSTGSTLYILDEPTTGLHFHDIAKLLDVLQRLVNLGNTVVVIEHNLDVIKCADWIIDLGPEGGDEGGEVVVEGTPEQIIECRASSTGKHLAEIISGHFD